MNYDKWEPIYKKILKDFNYKESEDIVAAKLLDTLLTNKSIFPLEDFKKLIEGKEVFVFGAGPSLENSILKNRQLFDSAIKIAADGATSALIKYGITPDVIVTDLDGNVEDQIKSNEMGSMIIIHAHGDNQDKIRGYLPKINGNIIGTTQTDPSRFNHVYNFGGFTDGDRAAFIADHFNAKKINLIGFDFDKSIGKYSFSKTQNKRVKLKKLKWCKFLLQQINHDKKILNFL
jgi:uncharacterized Rossmann fold enzyme